MAGSWRAETKGEVFSLEILLQGRAVCGRIETVTGDKVDWAWFVGTVDEGGARISFRPNFTGEDERGRAMLTMHGGSWQWRVTSPPGTENYIWERADLRRDAWGQGRLKIVENWCRSRWLGIQGDRLEEVDLAE